MKAKLMNSSNEAPKLPRVVLKFSGLDYYPSELIMGGLELLEHALHELESDAVRKYLEIDGREALVRAAHDEMHRLKRQHLQIYSARDGCIEFWAVGLAASFWVLQLIVGESMKDAYKKSQTHKNLSDIFSVDIYEFSSRLRDYIERSLKSTKVKFAFVSCLSRVEVSVDIESDSRGRYAIVRLVARDAFESIPSSILPLPTFYGSR